MVHCGFLRMRVWRHFGVAGVRMTCGFPHDGGGGVLKTLRNTKQSPREKNRSPVLPNCAGGAIDHESIFRVHSES